MSVGRCLYALKETVECANLYEGGDQTVSGIIH